AANMGVVLPQKNFLTTLSKLCHASRTLLIFDEVITGFRVDLGGAQKIYGIQPDLTCLGKIIGGGLPVGAYGGREDVMNCLSPLGGVYQAGTLSGNPLAMAAGIAALREISQKGTHEKLRAKTKYFCERLQKTFQKVEIPCQLNWTTGMFTLFFNSSKVTDFCSAQLSDTQSYAHFFHAMLEKGIYLPPSQFEANFISLSHSKKDLDYTLERIKRYFYEKG
ncbi:MAG: aminotransferase class III-fold pyridoxal phosphate-dependent enzyme, partial [Deltaproteobacteria bacterium]|nr:aminotransferase class III-fold pyridoxal phosphate-dependent enzyme [Deltaproteobacteria bacterium]